MLILASTVTDCVSISFTSLVAVPVGITNFAMELKICAFTAGIKNCMSIIKKKKKHDRIVLLGKKELHTIKVLVSKVLIDLYINQDNFVSVNNVLREYNEMKKEIKNLKTSVEYTI